MMISFSKLGNYGWLGNQMFQYAYLRSQALRMGVKFYCPPWRGDELFQLEDEEERLKTPGKIERIYRQPQKNCGFEEKATAIRDGTDVRGYFQSARYFYRPDLVKRWFHFKEEKIKAVRERWKHIDFSKSVGLHLRFSEKKKVLKYRIRYLLAKAGYYRRALEYMNYKEQALVFSDEPETARKWLEELPATAVYMEGNEDYEDLYLMTQCRGLICSHSTFSWWGAWLNCHSDSVIVVPKEGHFRPGHPWECRDYWCDSWIKIPAAEGFWDYFQTQLWLGWLSHLGVKQFG